MKAALLLLASCLHGEPVPHLRAKPPARRDYAAERARFPDAAEVEARTRWLRALWDGHVLAGEAAYPGHTGLHNGTHPVYHAWWIWDDLRLYDLAGTAHERQMLMDRVRLWLGEADYKRGRLPPARWWEMPIVGLNGDR